MFEPVHGSAPDIAGKGIANPIAMISSFGMALRYSLDMGDLADKLDAAIAAVLAKGLEGPDALTDSRAMLLDVIHQLDPKRFGIADQLREASVLLLLRPLLIDLLCASGMREDDARAELPEV